MTKTKVMLLNIEDIILAKWNYKTNSSEMEEKLKNQIRKNGFIENIIVRRIGDKYEVINGNHRVKVLKEMGEKEIVAVNLGELSDIEAKRIAIETNETRFDKDEQRLGEIIEGLSEVMDISELEKTMPFSKIELSELVGALEFTDWDKKLQDEEDKLGSDPEEEKGENHFITPVEKLLEDLGYYEVDEGVGKDFIKWAKKFITDRDIKTLDDFFQALF